MRSENTKARSFGWVTALTLTAVGLWSTRGLLDIVNVHAGVARVAMLPPWWLLVVLVVALGTIAAFAARAGYDADAVLPLCVLGLLALPYLPWLPDRVPALRVAGGPARNLLWLVVFWLIAARAIDRLRFPVSVSRLPLVIFLVSVTIFGAVAWRLTGTALFPAGDEPHYLVITQSLLSDGDLKIENNHQRKDYRAYFGGSLKPDYLTLGVDRQIYSIHPVGLSIIAMPAFALGGYRGVVAMLILMAALAATLMWTWARETTGSVRAATFAWAAVALSVPYLFNTFTVYPEIPAALAVMLAVAWRTTSIDIGVMVARGVAIGALPWLSTKYAPMAAAVTIVALLRARRDTRAILALLTPISIALTGWFAFFYWIWGTISPSAPYGSTEPLTWRYLARGGPGLLFDQEYGVMAKAPVLVLALVGLVQMLRSGGAAARRALELIFIFGALLITVGAFHVWWGGNASAGRPVASGLLLFGAPIASFFGATVAGPAGEGGRPYARAAVHVLLASSFALSAALTIAQGGALLLYDRGAGATLLTWASPTWPMSSAFPNFITGPLIEPIELTLAWLALGATVVWLIRRIEPREFGAAALWMLTLGFAGLVALVSLVNRATTLPDALTPEGRARVPLLDHFDAIQRPNAILYNPLSRVESADALSRVTLIARPGQRTAPQPVDLLWNARFALAAGEYTVRLTRKGRASPAHITMSLQIGREGPALEQWDVTGETSDHRFVLPIDAVLVGFHATPDVDNGEGELQITPLRIVDEGRRVARPPIIGALRDEEVTAFFHDDFVFGETNGYWTKGRATAQVTYASTNISSSTVDIVVRCGPVPNQATLSAPGWEQRLVLEPGAARHVAIPTIVQPELGVRIAPLTISVQHGFVPADTDRSTTDRRFLGCRFEI